MKEEQKIKNTLIKPSGDLIKNKRFFDFVKKRSRKSYVVVVTGGGKQINEVFKKAEYEIKFGPAGRETDFQGRQLSRNILEKNQRLLQNEFVKEEINATIEIPIINIGGVLCPVNGDYYVIAVYNGFDEIYILTTPERVKEKEEKFVGYPKIKIIEIKEV